MENKHVSMSFKKMAELTVDIEKIRDFVGKIGKPMPLLT